MPLYATPVVTNVVRLRAAESAVSTIGRAEMKAGEREEIRSAKAVSIMFDSVLVCSMSDLEKESGRARFGETSRVHTAFYTSRSR
jgi:hypothetical protein